MRVNTDQIGLKLTHIYEYAISEPGGLNTLKYIALKVKCVERAVKEHERTVAKFELNYVSN